MDATLLANNSQHCWMLHVECDCTPFKDGMSLRNGVWQAVYKSGTGTGCLVPRPHYYARPMRFGSRGPAVRLGYVTENALTERAWKDVVQGLGKGTGTSRRACGDLGLGDARRGT